MVKVKIDKTQSTSTIIATRPGIQISNCKKGGVGKTLLSKLKAAYCLESGLDFYAVDAIGHKLRKLEKSQEKNQIM